MDEVSVLLKSQADILSQLKENIKQLEAGFKALKKLDALTVKEEKKKVKKLKKESEEAPAEELKKEPEEALVKELEEAPEKKKRTYNKKK